MGAGVSRPGARDVIDAVLDPDSFESWDAPASIDTLPEAYAEELARAAERAATDESVLTGRGQVGGRDVVVIVSEFRFLGGSIGAATADRIVAAVRRATAERLPVLAAPASGGTRMQEGTPAFVRMADIARTLMAHRAEGLPYLAYLRHPTTGGVFASWGSLAQVTAAEPGALVGFLGPKVYEALNGEPFPAGVQTAENLSEHGIVDAVVPLDELRTLVDTTLAVLLDPPSPPSLRTTSDGEAEPDAAPDAWAAITATRGAGRTGVRDLLRYAATHTVRLHGTVEGERDSAVLIALTRLDGRPCVLVGQDRERQGPGAELGPA
ncbi:MAG TPA: carboxyl transferase domain-containing protein, partial [Nocardioides sp.]|nr:carboxyl transferase domain-containing protein [Nocardioides sp.]